MRRVIRTLVQCLVVSLVVGGLLFIGQMLGIPFNWYIVSITGGIAAILVKFATTPY